MTRHLRFAGPPARRRHAAAADARPDCYPVHVTHNGRDGIQVRVGAQDTPRARRAVAMDLRRIARMIEEDLCR